MLKHFAAILAILLLAGFAAAADPTVVNLNDVNYFYPNNATIRFTVADADAPADANIIISQCTTDCSDDGKTTIADLNSMTFCDNIVSATAQTCTYNLSLASTYDGNYFIDVNVWDVTNGDDKNDMSATVYLDWNGCTTTHTTSNDSGVESFSLSTVCSGISGDANALGTKTTYFGTSRQGRCPDNYAAYSTSENLSFGTFKICYYSTDGLGNTESTSSFDYTADSNALNLALLVELLLAAVLLVLIMGYVVTRELSPTIMIGLTLMAILIAVSIYIFAVVL